MHPIVQRFDLPPYYLITGEPQKQQVVFLTKLEACLKNKISLVYLRAKYLTKIEYKNLALNVAALCHHYNAKVLISDVELVQAVGADGAHLNVTQLFQYNSRPISNNLILGASCHNKAELLHAKQINVDFTTLSPVLPTTSHPDVDPMGWDTFNILSSFVEFPIFALGGLKKQDLPLAIQHGAHGIAAISAFWDIN